MSYSMKGCACGKGVSWIDEQTGKGYCEKCAQRLHIAIQKDLKHVWYGVTYFSVFRKDGV